jgi:hypothetical protein
VAVMVAVVSWWILWIALLAKLAHNDKGLHANQQQQQNRVPSRGRSYRTVGPIKPLFLLLFC